MVSCKRQGVLRLKILLYNHLLDPVFGGGTAERTYQLGKSLLGAGFEICVLSLAIGDCQSRIETLGRDNVLLLPVANRRYFIPAVRQLAVTNIVGNHDVVHIMGHWTVLGSMVAAACRKTGVPYVVCPAGALHVYGRSRFLKYWYNLLGGTALIQNADAHVVISANEIPQFARYGVDADKVTLIPNGIDTGEFSVAAEPDFRHRFAIPNTPFILFLGRLNDIKGPDLLLAAFSRISRKHAGFNLVFAGPDGGLRKHLEGERKRLELTGRVFFTGPVFGRDKVSAYKECVFLAIPSRREAMSIVALEAGICGKPVLLTDSCGFDEIEKVGGGLVVRATVDALAGGLDRMLERPSDLPGAGQRLQDYVAGQFQWRNAAQRYVQVFRRVLA